MALEWPLIIIFLARAFHAFAEVRNTYWIATTRGGADSGRAGDSAAATADARAVSARAEWPEKRRVARVAAIANKPREPFQLQDVSALLLKTLSRPPLHSLRILSLSSGFMERAARGGGRAGEEKRGERRAVCGSLFSSTYRRR